VENLAKARGQHEEWPDLAKKLSHEVHHHLREEERKFFQVSGKILSERQKTVLASKYRKDLERMRAVVAP
jgi:DNA-directed RNA polymerase specialized sigma subunit